MSNSEYLDSSSFKENSELDRVFFVSGGYGNSPDTLSFNNGEDHPQTIAFIDSNVYDLTSMVANIEADIKIILDPTQDGVNEITEVLSQYNNIDAVNIISHGDEASLQLGSTFLTADSLQNYSQELQQWTESLTLDADILFHGCNVAASQAGKAFVDNISNLTEADIAASTNLTGNSTQGGDWELEYTTGSIEFSTPFNDFLRNNYQQLLATLFDPSETPNQTDLTDGAGSAGDYELGMEFETARAGQIDAIRYWKAPSETGTHEGKIWDANGNILASVTFTNETTSGWQEQALVTPLTIDANTTYVVSVNVNTHYGFTSGGIANSITNGDITAVADGSNGVFNTNPDNFPTQSFNNGNYYRDVVFTPAVTNPNNNPGEITVNGTVQENQTLTATVTDADGITGANIDYQWQQSDDNGATWNDITGAPSQSLVLGDEQVSQIIRATAAYSDDLGSNETVTSNPTIAVSNINDLGTVTISGTAAVGNTVTAEVEDNDGLTGVNISYQWQRSDDNGATWNDIGDETNSTLTLDEALAGQEVRVNAIYTDEQGGSEDIFSSASAPISLIEQQSLFELTDTPTEFDLTDGAGAAGDYELGMEFETARAGQINAIRYWRAPSETGTHVGRIWDANGNLLASVTFENETASGETNTVSGWQEQLLETPLNIEANTTYVVSVNVNSHYAVTNGGLANSITNGDITAVADGSNGVFNINPDAFPTQSFQNSNYYRDIVFTIAPSNPDNNPGIVTVDGITEEDQMLTATVTDVDGLTTDTINYQWQQSDDNGATWNNIVQATNQTIMLDDDQVNKQLRVQVSYVDDLGSNETIASSPTTAVSNINDLGTVTISGIAAVGNTVTAEVEDNDGLTGVNISYQWQQSDDNGATWNDISNETNPTLTLDEALAGQEVRVNAIYTDEQGGSEDIFSSASAPISLIELQSLFELTDTPTETDLTDGAGAAGDYELGMEFETARAGQIDAIRYWKAPSETGTHVGRIWDANGNLLASTTFENETAEGWQEQLLPTLLSIDSGTTYVVSVNANSHYAVTNGGLANSITNGDITAVADGSNGVFNTNPNNFPTQSFQNSNYYRDIVFTIAPPNPDNNPGEIAISGTVEEDQTLTATLTDADGIMGANINYQWQQLEDGIWTNIAEATDQTIVLGDDQVNKQVRVQVSYVDALGNNEDLISTATTAVNNINDFGTVTISGAVAVGNTITSLVEDDDGLTGANIIYQWQQSDDNGATWIDITGATDQTFTLDSTLVDLQVRTTATYIDDGSTLESVFSLGIPITAQNAIVIENQNPGTRDWEIVNLATNNEITGFAGATSVNQGETIPIKVSLAQAGEYQIDVYRLGYYSGNGGRFITSSGVLNGAPQDGPSFDSETRLVEYDWDTSYNLSVGNDWTSGLYIAKLTELSSGKENQVWFAVRDDDRPADIGFQASFNTYQAYNNFGGYSVYDFNSQGGNRAFQVSFDRPFSQSNNNIEAFNNMLTWEYNMVHWMESQGYDISYFTNLDVHTNTADLNSYEAFLSAGHDEYWSSEMRDNVEQALDNGVDIAHFSANTAYWQVRFEPSSNGDPNRVMTVYKDTTGIGFGESLDPIVQTNPDAATTLFRSPEVNRPENGLLGVGYVGDIGANPYGGFDFVVSNADDPYYANTGLQNGDSLEGLVGYEWDAVLNNGFTPAGLVILSESPTSPSGGLPPLPPGTDSNISNAVRYTAPSGAKVFSTGSNQWMWGLDSDRVINPRVDPRAQQIAVNVFADMGATPQTPDSGIVVV